MVNREPQPHNPEIKRKMTINILLCIAFILGVFIIFCLPRLACNGPSVSVEVIDSTYKAQQNHFKAESDSVRKKISVEDKKIDSSKAQTTVIIKRITKVIHDTIPGEVKEILIDCGYELVKKDSLLSEQKRLYESLVAIKDSANASCDSAYNKLTRAYESKIDSLKSGIRKGKRRAFAKGLAVGFGAGLLVP